MSKQAQRKRRACLLPPTRFRAAESVDWVQHSVTPPPFLKVQRRKGRRADGVRYENRLQTHLLERFPDSYVPSPWFKFGESGREETRWCQPDGLLFDYGTGRITLIEAKLQHTSDAWWQTKWLYLPVLRAAFSPRLWEFSICEVVKWYDPHTHFPEKPKLCADILAVQSGEFGVHIWKP